MEVSTSWDRAAVSLIQHRPITEQTFASKET
jgi:hypothetical protein